MGSQRRRLTTALIVASTAVIGGACIPDGGAPPMPTSTVPTTTPSSSTIPIPLALISGGEPPLGTGATLPGGGSIILAHLAAAGAGPGLGGSRPLWQYSGSGVSTISANPAGGGAPGAPPLRDYFDGFAPGWTRAAVRDSGGMFPITIHAVAPPSPIESTPLGILSPVSGSVPVRSMSWSPDGRYLAVVADPLGAPVTDVFVFDTFTFAEVRRATFPSAPSLPSLYPARTAWTRDSRKVLVGTAAGIEVVAVSGAATDSSAPWPVAKSCGVTDVSVGGRVAVVCRNAASGDSLFNLYTQAIDGTEARLVVTPTLIRPLGSGGGISPEAFFSPDGAYLAVNLNTLPGLVGTRGGLAVVADDSGATPVLLTNPTPGTPTGAETGGDAPIGWIATPLSP